MRILSCRRPAIAPMIGVVNGVAEWVFRFEDRISVTISDAGRLLELSRDQIALMIWRDVQRVAGFRPSCRPGNWCASDARHSPPRPHRMPDAPRRRRLGRNLVLAGDWTATGLPATIESAVRSGNRAAELVLQGHSR